MRYLILLILPLSFMMGAEAEAPAPKPVVQDPPHQLTSDELNNLTICARRTMPTLSPDEMIGVAQAIKHAEADIQIMRVAEARAAREAESKPPEKK